MKVTRTIKSKKLNQGKYKQLEKQATYLRKIRSKVWKGYSSIKGASYISDRPIRDQWLKEKRAFKVLATAWKETLRDSFGDIKAHYEASKTLVRKTL